jgi:ABC-2 type transport system ATP-binding protein
MTMMTGAQHLALAASFHHSWDHSLIQRLAREWEVPLNRRVGMLSGGERQKIATLLALGHRPDLIIMDEPASGLDPLARRAFMVTLLEIAAETHRTILFSSHIVSDIERIASHVWILREGAIAWQGELDQLKESTVRVLLRAEREFVAPPNIAGALHCELHGNTAKLVLQDWTPERLPEIERQTGARVEAMPLTLEEIFLAVHA